ncbi:nucleoside diphosphate-linked moiety X motif 6-like [Glandiceps talaboti]
MVMKLSTLFSSSCASWASSRRWLLPRQQQMHMFRRTIATILNGKEDRYNGITVDLATLSEKYNQISFDKILKDSLHHWKTSGRKAIWIRVPILQSALIPIAAQQGFTFHHTQGDTVMLCRWLREDTPNRIPLYASHQVGVAGFVLNEDDRKVLMVQDKIRIALWKYPGGLSDPAEDIADTAVREVWEETGIKSEFQSILSFRQQHNHPNAFGNSDIYVICRLRPLTFDINICQEEVAAAQWMDVYDLAYNQNISAITTRLCRLAIYGLEEGFDNIDITMDELQSVYKGAFYKLFHRPLPVKYNSKE